MDLPVLDSTCYIFLIVFSHRLAYDNYVRLAYTFERNLRYAAMCTCVLVHDIEFSSVSIPTFLAGENLMTELHSMRLALAMLLVLPGLVAGDPCACIPCERTEPAPGNNICGPAWHQEGTSNGCGPALGNPYTGCYTNCSSVCDCHGGSIGTCVPPPPAPSPNSHCDLKPGAPPACAFR